MALVRQYSQSINNINVNSGVVCCTETLVNSLDHCWHLSPLFRLQAGGMVAERDIVQFVPFRQFAQVGRCSTVTTCV